MSMHGVIRRYSLIIEKVSGRLFPSLSELKIFLEDHGFEISSRTLQRDIEQIRYEFGLSINYDKEHNGYTLYRDSSRNDIDKFLRFLEIVNTAGLLADSLVDSNESLDFLSFESQGTLKGIDYLGPLLNAAKNRRVLTILYRRFQMESIVQYYAEPIFLKEYQNRWYLIAFIKEVDDYRTLAIDRMEDVIVLDQTFRRPDADLVKERFSRIVGLNYSGGEVERILLAFTPLQAKYVKTLPIHSSQRVISEDENETIVELFIIPNFELNQRLLMLADQVKVIEPKWLANEIQSISTRIAAQYKVD